jgi:hypothetical protein
MAPKKKPSKSVNQAAFEAANKLKVKGPQDEVFRREPNFGGYATKLNKAKGNPSQYNEGLGPIPGYKSTATKSKNRFKQGGYLA